MSTFPSDLFRGTRFAVMGLGRNGLPAARALMAMGAEVVAWDDKPEARAEANDLMLRDPSAARISRSTRWCCRRAFRIMPPKPHPVAERARAWGVPILSDAELLYRAVRQAGSRRVSSASPAPMASPPRRR